MARCVCPTCATEFDSDQATAMPFCSERCRLIDLGRWLGEQYSLPVNPDDESDESSSEPDEEA